MKIYKYYGNSNLDPWYLHGYNFNLNIGTFIGKKITYPKQLLYKIWRLFRWNFITLIAKIINPQLTCNHCGRRVKGKWGVKNNLIYCERCY